MTSATMHANPISESTDRALDNTILSPRFYTTDFKEMDSFDIESVRPEWNRLMKEFDKDINQTHFQRPDDMVKDYSSGGQFFAYIGEVYGTPLPTVVGHLVGR